jgi:Lipocalin-like domain
MKFDDFIGAWRLAGFRLIDADGAQTEPWLEGSDGMLIYSADGYMSAVIAVVDAPGGKPSHVAYSGPFEVQDDRVIHHVVMSSEPGLVGQPQTRMTEFDGKTLTLSSSPSIYGGADSRALLLWQRAD